MSNHDITKFPNSWRTKTPPSKDRTNPNDEPVNKRARTDKGHLRITELGSEEDSGNE